MKGNLMVLIIVALLLPIFALRSAFAEEKLSISAKEAIILFMYGDVKVKKANSWVDAEVEMVLSKGDSLKTGTNSWAEVGFGEHFANVVRIKENTFLKLIDLGPVRIGLLRGELRSLVESLRKGTTFEIKTPTAVCGARGTGWDTSTDGNRVTVDAYEDEVFFNRLSEDEKVLESSVVTSGKRGILEDRFKPLIMKNVPSDRIKDWSSWKDNFKERKAIESGIGKKRARKKLGKIQKTQDIMENAIRKGMNRALERKDIDKIERRIEKKKSSYNGSAESEKGLQ